MGTSRKVKALRSRLLTIMLKIRETVDSWGYGASCHEWVKLLNEANPHVPPVTNPMVRRCLEQLRESGHVKRAGHGRHRYWAILPIEKIQAAERERIAEARRQLGLNLNRLGVECEIQSTGFRIPTDIMQGVHDLLAYHPDIAAKYFTPNPDFGKEDDDA